MGANSQSDADSSDTDARIDTKSPTADRPGNTANTDIPVLADSATDHHGQSRFVDLDSEGADRLVDLLVKLAIHGENRSYAPRVDANQFLTVAKQCYTVEQRL